MTSYCWDFSIPLRLGRKERSDGIASKQMRLVRASMTYLFSVTSTVFLSYCRDFSTSLRFGRNDKVVLRFLRFGRNDIHKSISHFELYFHLFFSAVIIEFSIPKVLLYQNLYVFYIFYKLWFIDEIPKKVYFYWPKLLQNYYARSIM